MQKILLLYKSFIIRILVLLFITTFLVYFLTSPGESNYDYFGRLAHAMSEGKSYLSDNPPWLNELVPIDGKYYVVYPPVPAMLMVPFVFIFGRSDFQTLFSIILGAINVCLVYVMLSRLKFSRMTALVITLFFGFGTNHWYLASVGSAWFIAHIAALTFLLLALIEAFGKKRLFLIGVLLGISFWSRTPIIFTVPFFYIYFYKLFWPLEKKKIINFVLFNLGVGLVVFFDGYYNYIRFGDFSPFSPYNLIPNLDKDPVFKDGFMSLAFIPRHLEALFMKLPKLQSESPYLIPSLYATAIWFTSPLLIYIFNFRKNLLFFSSWIGVLGPLVIILLWAGVGYAQFGYRFAQDFMPFLLLLVALGIGKKPSWIAYGLLFLSILVNVWGTILINLYDIWFMG